MLRRRYGDMGARPMHWAYLFKQYSIGRQLVAMFPERVLDTVKHVDFDGETVLHIVIIHGNVEEARHLANLVVTQGEDGTIRNYGRELLDMGTTGEFFKKEKGSTYFGTLPLLFSGK